MKAASRLSEQKSHPPTKGKRPKTVARLAGRPLKPIKRKKIAAKKTVVKPFHPFGPPLPPEREAVVHQAARLVDGWKAGRLVLINNERDGDQITMLRAAGVYAWPPPAKTQPTATAPRDPQIANDDPGGEATSHSGGKSAPARHALSSARVVPEGVPGPVKTTGEAADILITSAPGLLRLLTALSGHATPEHPLVVLSTRCARHCRTPTDSDR